MKVIEKTLVQVPDVIASNLLVKACTKLNAKVDPRLARFDFMSDECGGTFQVVRYTWTDSKEERWPARIRRILQSKGFVGNTAVFLAWLSQSRDLDLEWYATIPVDGRLVDGFFPHFENRGRNGTELDLSPLENMHNCDGGAFVGFRRVS